MAKSIKQLSDHDLLVAAFTAAQTNQHALAIKHFKEALKRDPNDPFAYLEMAKCYFAIEYLENSQACLQKVSAFAKNDTALLIPLAGAYQIIRDYPKAIETMQKAEAIAEFRVTALTRQAELYELCNKLDLSENAIAKIQETERTPASLAILAKIYRRKGELDQARVILEGLIADTPEEQGDFVSSLRYELATLYDKRGNFHEAFRTLQKAKDYHVSTDAYNISSRGRKGVVQTLSGLCEEIERATLMQWKESQSNPRNIHNQPQHCFLLGHPRSGTTLIEQALDAHSDIQSADETSIFHNAIWMPTIFDLQKKGGQTYAELLDTVSPNYVRKLRGNYTQHWLRSQGSNARSHRIWLDKNPALTTRLAVIARFFPDASIVFALRDPRDVVLSSYMQPVGINDWSINWLTLRETVDYYCFAMQMWLDIRDKLQNPWIEVRYEDVVNDFKEQAQRVTGHLDLRWSDTQENVQGHVQNKVIYSPTYGDVTQPIYKSSLHRWRQYRDWIAPFEKQLYPFIQQFGYDV